MTAIVVSNISPALEEHHLSELFACCGPIKSLSMTEGIDRLCTIEYLEPAHAQAAALLSGTPLGDRNIYVVLKQNPSPSELFQNAVASVPLSLPLVQAAHKRADEVARTVYVGNLNLETGEEPIKKFFARIGTVLHVKLAGDNTMGRTGRFAFVEFDTREAADQALTMSGGQIGDRIVKVGRSNNPIFKPGSNDSKGKPVGQQNDILAKVKEYTQKLSEKVERKERRERRSSRSRSGSRGRKKKSKHRRRSRSRSRSRGRRGGRRRRSRTRSRSFSPLPPLNIPQKKKIDRTGMFFDGYNWQPISDAAQKIPNAMLMAQFASAKK
jgi:hypothetical protein